MKFTKERPYFWLFASLALIGLVADQASKYVVFTRLYPEDPRRQTTFVDVIPDLFRLQTNYTYDKDTGDGALSFLRTVSGERLPYVNKGALFGMGNGDGETGGMNAVFLVISCLAAGFILLWVLRPIVAQDRWLCLALGLILGGTLGNLYDRVVFEGVRDFLHCYYITEAGTHIWPDFNIADCCLVVGASILMIHSFFASEPTAQIVPPTTSPVEAAAPLQTSSPTPGA